MHINTGTVQNLADWSADTLDAGLDEKALHSYLDTGALVEVVKDEHGDWVEA